MSKKTQNLYDELLDLKRRLKTLEDTISTGIAKTSTGTVGSSDNAAIIQCIASIDVEVGFVVSISRNSDNTKYPLAGAIGFQAGTDIGVNMEDNMWGVVLNSTTVGNVCFVQLDGIVYLALSNPYDDAYLPSSDSIREGTILGGYGVYVQAANEIENLSANYGRFNQGPRFVCIDSPQTGDTVVKGMFLRNITKRVIKTNYNSTTEIFTVYINLDIRMYQKNFRWAKAFTFSKPTTSPNGQSVLDFFYTPNIYEYDDMDANTFYRTQPFKWRKFSVWAGIGADAETIASEVNASSFPDEIFLGRVVLTTAGANNVYSGEFVYEALDVSIGRFTPKLEVEEHHLSVRLLNTGVATTYKYLSDNTVNNVYLVGSYGSLGSLKVYAVSATPVEEWSILLATIEVKNGRIVGFTKLDLAMLGRFTEGKSQTITYKDGAGVSKVMIFSRGLFISTT